VQNLLQFYVKKHQIQHEIFLEQHVAVTSYFFF